MLDDDDVQDWKDSLDQLRVLHMSEHVKNSVCVDPSQKDFGAKELYNKGCGRCVNAQAFSFLIEQEVHILCNLAGKHNVPFIKTISYLQNFVPMFD